MTTALPSLSQELSLRLHTEMLRIRLVEQEIALRYPEQEMRCPCHLSVGQEAVAVGVCAQLRQEDRVFSAHRCHAHYLAKGGDLNAMVAEIYGKKSGCASGVGGSMHLSDLKQNFIASTPVVGGTMPVAAGMAFGDQLAGEERVTVAFFGDAATEEGIWSETLNFAALHKLPLLMVCEDNRYSSQSPPEVRQAEARSRIAIAEGHGVTAEKGDGNKVDEIYAAVGRAVERARCGAGPTYLDFTTYRWLEHCGPFDDTDLGYRTTEEVESWRKRCPLHYWKEKLALDDSLLRQEAMQEVQNAFAEAKEASFPNPTTLLDHVYAN